MEEHIARNGIELCERQRPVTYGTQIGLFFGALATFVFSGMWFIPFALVWAAPVLGLALLITICMCAFIGEEMEACGYWKWPDSPERVQHNKRKYYRALIALERDKAEDCDNLRRKFSPTKEAHHIQLLDIQIEQCLERIKMYQLSLENIANEERDNRFAELTGEQSKHAITL